MSNSPSERSTAALDRMSSQLRAKRLKISMDDPSGRASAGASFTLSLKKP
jgi:hypothetical protein